MSLGPTRGKHRVMKVLRISTILGFCIAVSSGVSAQTPCNPPDVIDSQITLGSIHDVTYCRQALVNDAFGTWDGNIPATLPVVTRNVRNPFWWVPNIAEVDNYHDPSSPPDATSEDALLYIAGPVSSGKVVILNGGHTGTCDWTQFPPDEGTVDLLQQLLAAGHSVLATNLLGCGNDDDAVTAKFADLTIGYYLAIPTQAMNYWHLTRQFTEYDMAGLSGGGWLTAIAAALDPRITLSFAVAGSMPGIEFVPDWERCLQWSEDCWPQEMVIPRYYGIAGYLTTIYWRARAGAGSTPRS